VAGAWTAGSRAARVWRPRAALREAFRWIFRRRGRPTRRRPRLKPAARHARCRSGLRHPQLRSVARHPQLGPAPRHPRLRYGPHHVSRRREWLATQPATRHIRGIAPPMPRFVTAPRGSSRRGGCRGRSMRCPVLARPLRPRPARSPNQASSQDVGAPTLARVARHSNRFRRRPFADTPVPHPPRSLQPGCQHLRHTMPHRHGPPIRRHRRQRSRTPSPTLQPVPIGVQPPSPGIRARPESGPLPQLPPTRHSADGSGTLPPQPPAHRLQPVCSQVRPEAQSAFGRCLSAVHPSVGSGRRRRRSPPPDPVGEGCWCWPGTPRSRPRPRRTRCPSVSVHR